MFAQLRLSSAKRWGVAIAAVLLLLAISIALRQSAVPIFTRVYTVPEALARRTQLNGQRITVRGYSLLFYTQTLQLCQPKRCDCNRSSSHFLVLVDKDTFAASQGGPANTDQVIEVHMLDCQGDECSLTCRPINPKTMNELELTGRFVYDPTTSIYAKLVSVELDLAREKIDGKWQPIMRGTFTVPLRQP